MRKRNIYRNSISRITRSAVVLAAALPALLLPSGCERENLLKEIAGEEAVMRFSVSESVPELLTKSQAAQAADRRETTEENVIVLTSSDGRTIRLIAEEEPLTASTSSASAEASASAQAPATKAAKIYSQSAALADNETFAVWAYNLADSNSPTNTWQLDGGTGTTPAEAKKVTGQNLWKPDPEIQYNTSNRTSSYKTRWFALAPYGAYSGTKASVSSLVIHENQAPTFTYTVPSAIEDQWDLLAATTASRDVADVSPVSLTFGHVLTGIRFKRDANLDVSRIVVSGVYNSARIDMSKLDPSGSMESFTNVDETSTSDATKDLWSNRTKSVTAPATEPSWTMDMTEVSPGDVWTNGNPKDATKEKKYDYAAKDANILMMIPQLTPQGAKITVIIGGFEYTGDISGHRWLPGRLVTYRIDKQPSFFSVSATKKVRFAPGNVQYKASTQEWRFAEHQWDFVGDDNALIAADYDGWIDLFGWATAGVKNPAGDYGYDSNHTKYLPYTPSGDNYLGFGPIAGVSGMSYDQGWTDLLLPFGEYDANDKWIVDEGNTWNNTVIPGAEIVRKYCDWGVHFNESGEGSQSRNDGTWFTMSYTQQRYLFMERTDAESLNGYAVIHISPSVFVSGIVILPDNWTKPQGCSFVPSSGTGSNIYYAGSASASQGSSGSWAEMEAAGAVFLPAAGVRMRSNETLNEIVLKEDVYKLSYWTSSFGGLRILNASDYLILYGWRLALDPGDKPSCDFNFIVKNAGCSVRLVHDVEP